VSLLLDTHTLAWWFYGSPKFPAQVRERIERHEGPVFASAVTAFEMAQKHRLGKWPEVAPLMEGFERLTGIAGMQILPLMPRHAIRAGLFPGPHRDPFDRLLVAQAIVEGLLIVSRDAGLRAFGVEPLWG
jgi:PIN domain nuclease of toxin-antitoxin system